MEVFVGNRPASTLDLVGPDGRTLREQYRIGEPRDCEFGNAEQMKRLGFVGIYRSSKAVTYRLPGTNLTLTIQMPPAARPFRARKRPPRPVPLPLIGGIHRDHMVDPGRPMVAAATPLKEESELLDKTENRHEMNSQMATP